jgi:hypothetical protein
VDIIYKWQKNSNGFYNFIENVFSLLGSTYFTGAFIVFYIFLVKKRVKSIVHLIFLSGALYYMTVLK